ncbi:MAG: cell envelope integrity protein CreD [Pseudomonadota bacterium]
MQKALLFKVLAILGLVFALCIPLSLIQSTISERMAFRTEAINSIASDSVREQTLVGPILVVHYAEDYDELVANDKDPAKKELVHRTERHSHFVFPNDLQVGGQIDTDRRYRGIHQVLVYTGQYNFTGDFDLPARADLPRTMANSRITVGSTYIALSVDDVRGIRNIPKLNWDGKLSEFAQGSGLASFKTGLHAPVDAGDMGTASRVKFAFALGLDGIERQHFAPVGKNNKVTLKSNWPHPQFGGRFLPSAHDRTIDQNGFAATWNISSLATGAQQQILQLEAHADDKGQGGVDRFNVGFIEPINVYSLADRATKYGLLFVALTFAAFFVFEILKRLTIHPVQYLLVGLALALFFLLLLGLSEHIAFWLAYLLASVACIVLIGYYLANVLHDWRRGFGFGAALTALYGTLYGLLISENNALVLGSLLLFAVLAAIMVATRKVNWYQLGNPA